MFHRISLVAIATSSALLFSNNGSAQAAPISVGSGPATVEVIFNWADGFVVDYLVHYGASAATTISGYDATAATDATDTGLTLNWDNFGTVIAPNYFLGIASYAGGHTGDSATFSFPDAQENFWHEWVDEGSGWTFGGGASTDILSDGDRIGWVFGLAATPVPEPAAAALLAVASGCALLKRRRLMASN
jgi:hypothetical protein